MVKKKSKALPQKQKSRAQYFCPPELGELIFQVNLVPINEEFPDYTFERERELQRLREETGVRFPSLSGFEFLAKLISHLPDEFLEYLQQSAKESFESLQQSVNHFASSLGKGVSNHPDYELTYLITYFDYFDMRDSMLRFVQHIEQERQMLRDAEDKYPSDKEIFYRHNILIDRRGFPQGLQHPIPIKTRVKRGEDGNLYINGIAALIGKFDDSRLRRCVICEKRIFWAKREDSKTCSSGCLNKLNVRRHRKLTAEQKAEKKVQREANRERNKKLKEIREKKNAIT
jgi:hypothetical protein